MEQKLDLFGHRNYQGRMLTIIVFSLLMVNLSTANIKLVDHGYENVLVQIQDSVPENKCQSVFRGIEAAMTRASSVLYRATHQRIYFKNVTVVVPHSWSGSHCSRQLVEDAPQTRKSDFIIGDPHPVFLHNPWTLQEQGCGRPGNQIFLTPEFLSMRNHSTITLGDPGRLIVHEWAKYRWGVFEEHGHDNDPIYPSFLQVTPHSFQPTGCSNIPVKGTTDSCTSDGKNCHFTPDLSQNDNVTSSLMYLHYLPRVTEFCDSQTHDSRPQTKHNILCGRKSVWEVIQQHEDFIIGSSGSPTKDVTPSFNFIRPSHRRFVIAIEVTAVMNVQKRWDFLRKAVRKFLVYDIPSGHEVAIVLFDDDAWVQKPFSVVSDSLEQRWRLASGSLPRSPSQKPSRQKCISCGLKKAKEILDQENGNGGGVIILISSGSPPQIPPSAMQLVEEIRNKGKIQIVPIIYPVTSVSSISSPGLEYFAEATNTKTFTVLDEGMGTDSKIFMMASLMNDLYSAIRIFFPSNHDLPALVHQKEHPGGLSKMAEGIFDLDESLGGEMKIVITYFNWGHVGDDISLIDPSGTKLYPPNFQDEDAGVNTIFYTFQNAKAGRWRYGIENLSNSHQGLYIYVLATPAKRNTTASLMGPNMTIRQQPSVILSAWTNLENNTFNINSNDSSIIIYAKLWSGMRPVIGARVEAVIQRLGFNSSRTPYHPQKMVMYDNGNGDPDITRGDGIYSRYVPILSNSVASFSIKVIVSDKNNRASIISESLQDKYTWRNKRNSYRKRRAAAYGIGGPTCCGSNIPHSRTVDAGFLSRIVSIGVINLKGNFVKPSRIGNFRASVNPATLHATFYWTAPGEYNDHGTASRYEVIFSTNVLASAKGEGEVIKKWPQPQRAGAASQYTIRWLRHDAIYYVAIRAIGSTGKSGEWSNTAFLYVPPPATTTEINTRDSTPSEKNKGETIGELGPPMVSKNYIFSNNILAIIITTCILLLIILFISFYFLIIVSRRRNNRDKNTKSMIEGSVVAAVTSDKDDEADSINKEPPEQLPSVPDSPNGGGPRSMSPIQSWPASKLLAEHERRRSSEQVYGETPDLGVPYHPSIFYYHQPNGGYIEDTIPIDSGSMISSQPSELFAAYKIDNQIMENVHPILPHATTPVSWDGMNRPKVPPPTLPKPSISSQKEFCPHAGDMNDNKRRTITQV